MEQKWQLGRARNDGDMDIRSEVAFVYCMIFRYGVFLLCFQAFDRVFVSSSMVIASWDNDNFTFPLENKAPE